GNSLGCRSDHAMLAVGDPGTHCKHAGPSGAGTCGTTCQGFCSIASVACPTQYPAASCAATCATIPTVPPYTSNTSTGDTIECRLHYAVLATLTPATNCTEASENNTTQCQ